MTKSHKKNIPLRIMDFRGTYKGGGGPDKTILNSAKLHDFKRVSVLVTYLRDPRDKEFQITERAKQMGIPFVEVLDRWILDLFCLFELYRLIKKYKIEMIHAHDDKTLLYGWLLKLLNPKIIIIFTCHLLVDYDHKDFPSLKGYLNYLLREKIAVILMKRFQRPIMAVSRATKKQLAIRRVRQSEVVVLHNGIDIDIWKKSKDHKPVLRQELGLNQEDYLVGTVARISYQKDFSTFIKVAQNVIEQMPNIKFAIVGDGKIDELAILKKEVKDLGLEKCIYFTGHRNDLFDVYSSFDLFLMTSIMEGLPNTVLEAMAMSLPVVSTDVAGVPELVDHGVTGLLSRVGEDKSLSEQVVRLLSDRKLHQDFALAARRRVEDNFSFKGRVRKLEDLYLQYGTVG